tara:strand:- start:4324 stop:4782 length:459 start_codon:yes stop_codon:yes gene_type:complete
MATRSEIAIENADGSIKSVYCHSDGYIKYLGVMLKKHYNNFDKASSIINENDCSVLKPTIKQSRFYNSWRGEDTKSKHFPNEYTFMKYFQKDIFAEYIYLFKDDQWHVSKLIVTDNPNENYYHCLSYRTKFERLMINKHQYKWFDDVILGGG